MEQRRKTFDTDQLAAQLAQLKPGYFFLTIGQITRFYCSPNDTFKKLPALASYFDILIADTESERKQHHFMTPSKGIFKSAVSVKRGVLVELENTHIESKLTDSGYEIFCILPEDSLGGGKKLSRFRLDTFARTHIKGENSLKTFSKFGTVYSI